MSKKTVVPKLRFQEFEGNTEWLITVLGDISVPIEKRTGTKKYTLMSVTSGVGLIPQVEKFGREIAGSAYKNYIVIQRGDFAYNKSATKLFPEGYIAMLTDYYEAALPNSIFTCFRITDNQVCVSFFYHVFQSNYHGSWLRKFIAVGARAHGSLNVDDKHLWEMPVAIPKLPEQQKIADCLSSLDDLIAAENKKLDVLKTHKKGLMQKLFPAEGKTLPQVRFERFTGSWQEKRLEEVTTKIGSGKTPSGGSALYLKSGIPLLRSQNITNNNVDLSDVAYISEATNKTMANSRVQKRDVLLNITGASIGRSAVYEYTDLANVNQHVCIIRPDEGVNEQFIQLNLASENGQRQIKNNQAGGGREGINFQKLAGITFAYPCKTEQIAIGNFFSNFEKQITAQTEKIETLKLHKKGLMQGLFPSAQEIME